MSNVVETNQLMEAKMLLALDGIASEMGDHRDSVDYYEKLSALAEKTVELLADIVLEES